MRSSKLVTISLPQELVRASERNARREHMTRSELMRVALRRYLEEKDVRVRGRTVAHLDEFFKEYGPVLERLAKH